jgi:hypothetical protein
MGLLEISIATKASAATAPAAAGKLQRRRAGGCDSRCKSFQTVSGTREIESEAASLAPNRISS